MSTKTKDDIVREIKAEIEGNPEGAKEPMIAGGDRTLSLEDVLAEIENDTDLGKEIVSHWIALSTDED